MNTKTVQNTSNPLKKNPLETISDIGSNIAHNAVDSFKHMGSGMLDQVFGGYEDNDEETHETWDKMLKGQNQEEAQSAKQKIQKESNLFNYTSHHETIIVKDEIKKLVEQIKREIEAIKKADKSLLNEVADIQKIAVEQLPTNPGVYHVRFLEIVLRILTALRQKIGESKTWMQALISKKKKRGSLFAVQSKKKGTLYSMSQELQTARSVQ